VSTRAMVRKDDDRAARLRTAGVEVVLGDLLDLDSVARPWRASALPTSSIRSYQA
jgi:hypothetical protein